MMVIDLSEIAPEFFGKGEVVFADLERIYKEESRCDHETALVAIYKLGAKDALDKLPHRSSDFKYADLQHRYLELSDKYEALMARVGGQVNTSEPDEEVTRLAASQALGMGVNLKR